MLDAIRRALETDSRIGYALLFGSRARGEASVGSDTDIAVGLAAAGSLTPREIGDLVSRLETATGGPVDLVLLDEATPALAYRVFRDGELLFARDAQAVASRKARAILEYLDFKPVEDLFTRRVLQTTGRG